ncbi:hypothetical protein HBA92_21065 [Ochrobactrum sp. MR28]|nr:hypothetical protein [Ochrobactrum sp. MR28]MBX8818777.1 hypothetical protein [Ochrobactrum sp. MR31]
MSDGEWISISDAAQRLTAMGDLVERSTLSRYIKQHSEAIEVREEGKARLVEFETLVTHRSENIRIRVAPPITRTAAVRGNANPAPRFSGSQSDGAARKAQADAELREMDLAERRKILTKTAEVDQAGRDAIALMQSAFERAIETEAASASVKFGFDERTMRIVFKTFMRRGLEVFNQTILGRIDAMRRQEEADENQTHKEDNQSS